MAVVSLNGAGKDRNEIRKGSLGPWQTGAHVVTSRRESCSRFSNTTNQPDKAHLPDGSDTMSSQFPNRKRPFFPYNLSPAQARERKGEDREKSNSLCFVYPHVNPSVQVVGYTSPVPSSSVFPGIGSCFSCFWLQAWPCYLLWLMGGDWKPRMPRLSMAFPSAMSTAMSWGGLIMTLDLRMRKTFWGRVLQVAGDVVDS